MNDEIRQIGINEFLQLLPEKQENVMTREVMLMMDSEVVRPMVAIGQPYQLHEGRLLRVVSGRAQLTINLRTTLLTAQSVCKNVQKSVLTNVNWQRNASPYFQMFAFSFFGGNVICRFLPIFCPSNFPRHNFCPSKIMLYH